MTDLHKRIPRLLVVLLLLQLSFSFQIVPAFAQQVDGVPYAGHDEITTYDPIIGYHLLMAEIGLSIDPRNINIPARDDGQKTEMTKEKEKTDADKKAIKKEAPATDDKKETTSLVRKPNIKDSWYIGLGVGYGDGLYNLNGFHSMQKLQGNGKNSMLPLSFQFGLGRVEKQYNHGLECNLFLRGSGDSNDLTINSQLFCFHVVATFFIEEGIFLKGGAGWAIVDLNTYSKIQQSSSWLNGISWTVGFGKAYSGEGSARVHLGLDYSMQYYKGDKPADPTASMTWNLYLSLYWY